MRVTQFVPVVAAGLMILSAARAADAPVDERVRSTVEGRVAGWWPTADEKRFDGRR